MNKIMSTIAILITAAAIARLPGETETLPAEKTSLPSPRDPGVLDPATGIVHVPGAQHDVVHLDHPPAAVPPPATPTAATSPQRAVYTSASACGPNGCGPVRGLLRGGLFGRRR